jgi:hypothetical protein
MTLKSGQVGNEIFLQNRYFSVGVNSDGGLGTQKTAPTGFASDLTGGFQRVGLYADLDGFGMGSATTLHDAVLPGRTIEGFNVGYKIGDQTIVASNQQLTGFSEISGTVANRSTATKAEADWTGSTAEKLGISQKLSMTDDAKFIRIDVTLTNNSAVTMSDVRYMRTADADQGSTFSTENKIVSQGSAGALVASYTGGKTPFFLYSDDARARVSTYGFVNSDPYAPLAYDAPQAAGYVKTADQTVNLTFSVGTLAAGKSTTVTLYMGVTDDLSATVAAINSSPVNLAPIAADDVGSVIGSVALTGNVLANDRDPEGAKLVAALKTGPVNGTVSLGADGSYIYKANAAFVGTDSFTYIASDGKATDTARVTIVVGSAPTTPQPVGDPVLTGTVDGSAATSDALSGPAFHNSFFFNIAAVSGVDKIVDFEREDVLVTSKALYDGNGDGIISLHDSKLRLGGLNTADAVTIDGINALRLLGSDTAGNIVYADAGVRPNGAVEGTLANDALKGEAVDTVSNIFFADTALDIQLGKDRIDDFGAKDLIVTTSALSQTPTVGGKIALVGGLIQLAGGTDGPDDSFNPGEVGTMELHHSGGAAVAAIEFDGAVAHDGTTYFVYSLAGSVAGVADLTF